ncbi:MAG: hypothetical protein K2K82_08700 [Muribaculaceae bacterium]|nr:hypothetical protein [Muribaculaceae bacterium]
MATTQPIITRDTLLKMISLLDYCYRLGVEAAREVEDEGLCREFLERTKEPGVYGLLSENPVYITWQEWTLRLLAKARSTSWNGSMVKFFNKMGKFSANYLSAFLPCSMVFYCRGISDYLNAPTAVDFAMFQSKSRVWWTKNGLKKINPRTWVDELQMICFDLERRDAEVWARETPHNAKKIALTQKQYELFRRCIGLVPINNMGY